MGVLDVLTTELMKDNHRFADAFNFALFDGRQVIDPDQLTELDTTVVSIPYNEDGTVKTEKRLRDVLKLLTIKTDGQRTFVLLGGENQGHIHYAMPVRCMLYDALNYSDQVDKTAKSNRENGRLKDSEAAKGEYLSGLLKTDRIHPIITLVIYFGADKWDGPLSLHDMFDVKDDLFLQFVPDYKLNLITPYDIGYDDFDKFGTDLKKVLIYIKLSSDKKKLKEEVHSNPEFWTVEPAIGKLIDAATGSKLRLKGKGGMVQMWNAIDEIKEEGRAEGKAEGRIEGKIETIIKLIKNGIITSAIGAQELGITESELAAMPQMQLA